MPSYGAGEFYDENKLSLHPTRNDGFQKLLESSLYEGMKIVLGDSGALAVMSNWKLGECLKDPKEFHNRLFAFLNEPGTTVIEKSIAKQLFRSIGQPYPKAEAFDFELILDFARRMHDQTGGAGTNYVK